MFVASLEGVSEMFISGVEVEDDSAQMGKEKELGGVVAKGSNGVIPRKPVANGNGKGT